MVWISHDLELNVLSKFKPQGNMKRGKNTGEKTKIRSYRDKHMPLAISLLGLQDNLHLINSFNHTFNVTKKQ